MAIYSSLLMTVSIPEFGKQRHEQGDVLDECSRQIDSIKGATRFRLGFKIGSTYIPFTILGGINLTLLATTPIQYFIVSAIITVLSAIATAPVRRNKLHAINLEICSYRQELLHLLEHVDMPQLKQCLTIKQQAVLDETLQLRPQK